MNRESGQDFEDFAMPTIREWAGALRQPGDQVDEQTKIPGAFVNTVPELHITDASGFVRVIVDAKSGSSKIEQMAGYVDALDAFDPAKPPGRLVLAIPGPPSRQQRSLINAVRRYIAGTYQGRIKGKDPHSYQRGTTKRVTVEFLVVPGWAGELPPRFRGEP